MLQPPYRVAVIGRTGRGNYGHGLDVAWLDEPKAEIVAVADDDPKGLAAASKRLGVDRAYADYREMLDREKPQFVSVAPRWLDPHREMVLACAEHGVRGVFCEKPLAPTLADCDAIVDACEQSHMKLAIAFQTRYSPILDRVQELVKSGAIGELLELRGRGKEDHRGGGEDLMVLGSHIMDLFRVFLGEAAWCFAVATDKGESVGPDQVREGPEGIGLLAGDRIDALYGFASSPAVAHFATSRPAEPGDRFGLTLCGSKGCIQLGTGWLPPAALLDDPSWTTASGRSSWVPITSAGPGKPEPLPPGGLEAANRLIVADLIRAVEEDDRPRADVLDARASIELILATYASQGRRGPVALPLKDRQQHPLEALGPP